MKKYILKHQQGGLSSDQTKLIEEGKSWLENWLSKRKGLLNENAIFAPGRDPLTTQLSNLYQTEYINDPNLEDSGLYKSRDDNDESSISIKQWIPDTVVHEQTHALEPIPQVEAIRQLMANGDYSPQEIKDFWKMMKESPEEVEDYAREAYGKYGQEYWDDPNEIYARRNAVLKRYGKDPNYKYTEKDLENMIDLLYDNDLDTYNDDFLLHLFNDIASNNKPISMINMAKQGGIIKLQRAGTMPATLEAVPIQRETTSVRVAPVEAQFKLPPEKLSAQQRKQRRMLDEVTDEVLRQENLKVRKEKGIIDDKPLQEEHPGLLLVPEAKMNGLIKGTLRTIGGLVGGAAGSELGEDAGNTIDDYTGRTGFGNAGRTLGGIFGYGVGSAATGAVTNSIQNNIKWLNTKVPVNPNEMDFIGAPDNVIEEAKIWAPKNYQILFDKARHAVGKLKYAFPRNNGYAKGKYIGHGAEAEVFENAFNPNSVVKVQYNGTIVPRELKDMSVTGSTVESAIDKGTLLADIKSKGAYTVPQRLVGVEPLPNGRFAPIFEQPKVSRIINPSDTDLTKIQRRRLLTTYAATDPTYADVHIGNMAFDGKNIWLIDNPKKSLLRINRGFSHAPTMNPSITNSMSNQIVNTNGRINTSQISNFIRMLAREVKPDVSSNNSITFYPSANLQ